MAFCRNCGSALSENASFCTSCGAQQGGASAVTTVQPAAQPVQTTRGGMHCPNCKATQITPINETSLDGAISTSHTTRFSSTHRNYWMCSHCGTKFRSIPNLEEEIAGAKKRVITNAVMAAIFAIVAIVLIVLEADFVFLKIVYGAFAFSAGVTALICGIFVLTLFSNLKKMKKELAYLKYHCFN